MFILFQSPLYFLLGTRLADSLENVNGFRLETPLIIFFLLIKLFFSEINFNMIKRAYPQLSFYLSSIRCLDERRMNAYLSQIVTLYEKRRRKKKRKK
jgi:hypothetical protein